MNDALSAGPAGAGPAAHAVLRVGAGLLFLMHGLPKQFGLFGGMGPDGGAATFGTLMGWAGIIEVYGGALIVLGLLTRPVAVVTAAEMIYAYFKAHLPRGWVPYENGGELALLYLAVWIFLIVNGAGPFSIDRWCARRRASAA